MCRKTGSRVDVWVLGARPAKAGLLIHVVIEAALGDFGMLAELSELLGRTGHPAASTSQSPSWP